MDSRPKVIAFDAFGTLVKISEGKSPYLKLMKWLKINGRKPDADDARVILTHATDIKNLGILFGKSLPENLSKVINEDIENDLKKFDLYLDTIGTLQTLRNRGFQLALCSNLAKPYGEKLKLLMLDNFDEIFFSYELGCIKPEVEIYKLMTQYLNCKMSDILFIGDNPILDVEIPKSLGMSAQLIERSKGQTLSMVLSDILNS